eukprot:14812186-Alexandrium_andersonii.AAC.1
MSGRCSPLHRQQSARDWMPWRWPAHQVHLRMGRPSSFAPFEHMGNSATPTISCPNQAVTSGR